MKIEDSVRPALILVRNRFLQDQVYLSKILKSLEKNGIYLLGNPALSRSVRGRWTSMTSSKKVVGGTASYRTEDLIFLKELIEAGKIARAADEGSVFASEFVFFGQFDHECLLNSSLESQDRECPDDGC